MKVVPRFRRGDMLVTAFRVVARRTTAGGRATSVSLPTGTPLKVREVLLVEGATLPTYDVVDAEGESFSIPEHKLEKRVV